MKWRQQTKIGKLLTIAALLSIFSCSEKETSNASSSNLPAARGKTGEIIVVMDTMYWHDELGEALRSVFSATLPGTLRGEKMFSLRKAHGTQLNNVLKQHKNLIFVMTLEQNSPAAQRIKSFFPEAGLQQIASDSSLFYQVVPNSFAVGQIVLFLFGQTNKQLANHLRINRRKMQDIFAEAERKRITAGLSKLRAKDALESRVAKTHGIELLLPRGFEFVKEQVSLDKKTGFLWVRMPDAEVDKSLILAYKPYESDKQFREDSIIAWRNAICKAHLYGDPAKPHTFVVTESLEPPVFRESTVNGKYAKEMRGLWRTNNSTMGGPFISYTFADAQKGIIYYYEGLIFAPSRDRKREIIRELEAILRAAKY
ncbi:MAG: DUF4837 family protein [Cytophagales bacterium]|nr:DUF4837 family protein [Bernardetiaceae bacterium]MDW8211762.1 DUF4837 family protein [Cytophagales bacterium]